VKTQNIYVLIARKPGDKSFTIAIAPSPSFWLQTQNSNVEPALYTQILYIDPTVYSSTSTDADDRKAHLKSLSHDLLVDLIQGQNPAFKPLKPPNTHWNL
jgi:hypothetical protein